MVFFETLQNIGNREKGRISKRVFQENKARQIFQILRHGTYLGGTFL